MAATIYPRQFLFLLSIFSILHKSISYPGTSSSIINPAKVKQVSWKPRSLSLSLSLSDLEISHIHLLSETESKMKLKIMTMALQG
jgi:prolyl 4-hydroxylase